jgi:hypothetical protein
MVQASLNFAGDLAGRPFVDVNRADRNRLPLVAHDVEIKDARPLTAQLSLNREGFILVDQKLPNVDFTDEDEIVGRYLPAIQELVSAVVSPARIVTSDGPVVRYSQSALQRGNAAYPANFVHTDYTARAARKHMLASYDRTLPEPVGRDDVRDLLNSIDEAAPEQRFKRVLAVQTWRVFSDPPHDKPLAICAADSVSPEDFVEYDYVIGDREGEIYQAYVYRHNPRQRWFSFLDLTPDEVLLFIGYDFQRPHTCVMHAAFDNPLCPPGAPGRCSIEARTFAFFED